MLHIDLDIQDLGGTIKVSFQTTSEGPITVDEIIKHAILELALKKLSTDCSFNDEFQERFYNEIGKVIAQHTGGIVVTKDNLDSIPEQIKAMLEKIKIEIEKEEKKRKEINTDINPDIISNIQNKERTDQNISIDDFINSIQQ